MAYRHGLSLVEMMIALALFTALMVAVVETAISVRGFSGQHEDIIDLEQEGRTILNQVTADLSNSGWFNNGSVTYPNITAVSDLTFGNEVRFLRIRAVAPGSTELGIAHLDFSVPISRMEEWKTPLNAVTGLVADEEFVNNGPTRLVTPVWEPISSRISDPLSYAENSDPTLLRAYRYRVIPSPSGRGTLRREFREGTTGTWQQDTSLGDLGQHIFSFVVAYQPGSQRVRISLELRRDVPERGRAIRRFEGVAAMRSVY
jgi:prepilin-type N-terminal cleavage/methylation domain-containing protein